jgi:two-component system, chemotaxis family, chemotaxis protein CheY
MKILLVDDSALSRNILKRLLGEEHQYINAEDGMRGLELYFLEHPDIVFLDLTMPGVNGLEVLEKMRKMDPEARIIIATADIQNLTRQKASQLGADAFVTKPFTPEGLQGAIKEVMKKNTSNNEQR